MRQNGDIVGAAKTGGRDRDRHAQHVHVGVALGHHPPSRFGRDRGGLRRQAAGHLHARPQFPDGAKFRDGEKLVGVGRKPEIDHAACGIERHAAGFKRAQAVHRGGDGESQLLRLRTAGIVNDAPVRHHQWAAKSLIGEAPYLLGEVFRQFAPRPWTGPRGGKAADRVETSAHVDGSRRKLAAFHQRREVLHGSAGRGAEIEVDGNAGIEFDVLEHALDHRRRCVQAIAVGVERTGENQSQAGRAVFEVLKRSLVGRRRIDHPDPAAANKQALEDLENGATGLTLVFAGSLNANGYGLDASAAVIERVLKDVELDAGITIDFNLSAATRTAVQHFAALVKSRKLSPASVDMRGSLNPIGGFAASGTSPRPWSELSKYFAEQVRGFVDEGFRGPLVVADGRIIHNAGGSEAQELAFAIAAAVDCLRALEAGGMPLDAARGMIYFRLSADADEFLTIAKFRAIRKLWARVEVACGLTPKPTTVAAETAWRMMTKRDPDVNMLRMTIAVTAAGLGGADNIAVLPHSAARE